MNTGVVDVHMIEYRGMNMETKQIIQLTKQIEALQKQMRPFIEERNELRETISLAENTKLIGKYFKFKNSYGAGKKWWLYKKIVAANTDSVTTISAEKDNDESISIQTDNRSATGFKAKNSGYTPITKREFSQKFKKLLAEVNELVT